MAVSVPMKDYFRLDSTTPLSAVHETGNIHVIGVAGVAMAQLAIELANRGYVVSGSDLSFYEPTGSLLRSSPVALCEGYRAENIPAECNLVIIGNALSVHNPEVQEVKRRALPFSLFPQALYETVIRDRVSLVVSGTHGKSTSSALAAFVMASAGLDPSYFIGGKVEQLHSSLRRGLGRFSVVEGDEYDSAFFAKLPKFHFYAPDVLLITSVEFDHADIYPDERAIESEFERLIDSMKEGGVVVACSQGEGILGRIRERCRRLGQPRFVTYGFHADDDYRVERSAEPVIGQQITITHRGRDYHFSLRLSGAYNALNAAGVFALLAEGGVSMSELTPHFSLFSGVTRRQEIIVDADPIRIIEDFAHHPTAVRATLEGLREQYPARRMVVLFEPRSNTSRRALFQEQYASAFDAADMVILCAVTKRAVDEGVALLDTDKLVQDVSRRGPQALVGSDPDRVFERYLGEFRTGDLLVVMSNGGFGGIIERLREHFSK